MDCYSVLFIDKIYVLPSSGCAMKILENSDIVQYT